MTVEDDSGLFAYLAFDENSSKILAHGPKAFMALADADRLAPEAPIHVISALGLGRTIWDARMSLGAARLAMLECRGGVLERGLDGYPRRCAV